MRNARLGIRRQATQQTTEELVRAFPAAVTYLWTHISIAIKRPDFHLCVLRKHRVGMDIRV